MSTAVRPALARRQLCQKLRRARSEAGKTQTEVAEALEWSASKILRIEGGKSAIAVSDLIALISQYPRLQPELEALKALAKAAKAPSLASQYGDALPGVFRDWVEFESASDRILQYEPQVVPGVLQTDDYATSLVGAQVPDRERVSRIVEARIQRSSALVSNDGPAMELLLDETALLRAGDHEDARRGYPILLEQLEHLMKMNTVGRLAAGEKVEEHLNPRISIQIAPLAMGPYAAMRHPFELLEFVEDDSPWMMYFEGPDFDQVFHDKYDEIEKYIDRFNDLKRRIPGPAETNEKIRQIAHGLGNG